MGVSLRPAVVRKRGLWKVPRGVYFHEFGIIPVLPTTTDVVPIFMETSFVCLALLTSPRQGAVAGVQAERRMQRDEQVYGAGLASGGRRHPRCRRGEATCKCFFGLSSLALVRAEKRCAMRVVVGAWPGCFFFMSAAYVKETVKK